MNVTEGTQVGAGFRFGIVVSRFNEVVTNRLLSAALETLEQSGVGKSQIHVVKVPGAFEIPLVAKRLAQSRRVHAVLCLGAVIRGETPHFDYICTEVSRGIARTSWDTEVPVIFGVVTTETVEQALERSGGLERNRGAEAARTALEMATLMKQLPKRSKRARLPKSTSTSRRPSKVRGRS